MTKSEFVGLRITEHLRRQLEEASRADQPPRSLSQEIEQPLSRSFNEGQRIENQFGGSTTKAFLQVLGERIRAKESDTGWHWWVDRYTFEECRLIAIEMFELFRVKGRRTAPREPGDMP